MMTSRATEAADWLYHSLSSTAVGEKEGKFKTWNQMPSFIIPIAVTPLSVALTSLGTNTK